MEGISKLTKSYDLSMLLKPDRLLEIEQARFVLRFFNIDSSSYLLFNISNSHFLLSNSIISIFLSSNLF